MKLSPITSDSLDIEVRHDGESVVVLLQGRLGIDSSPDLKDRLLAILRGQTPKVVIVDLTKVSYVDTSGIATLLEAFKIARGRHIDLHLSGLQGRLARLFEVTGVSALFERSGSNSAPSPLRVP